MPTWIAILIGAGVTLAGVVVTLMTLGLKLLEKRDERAEWRGKVDADRDSFKEFMVEIRATIEKIHGDIKNIFIRLGPAEAAGVSPLQLTHYGRELLTGIDGASWAVQLAGELKKRIEGLDAYQIRGFCFKYVETELQPSDEQRTAMRRTAYQKAARMEQVHRVLAIELRDRLLDSAGLEAS